MLSFFVQHRMIPFSHLVGIKVLTSSVGAFMRQNDIYGSAINAAAPVNGKPEDIPANCSSEKLHPVTPRRPLSPFPSGTTCGEGAGEQL
jgi:hypothetical protein